ncbi:MAG: helicase-related protein, partial [Endomicrobia bacterium]|nr:helicase-related protein [Endomicrobiia bacterium]
SQAYTQDELLLQVKELFSNNFFQTINCSEQQIPGNDIVDIQCCPTVRYFANIDIFNKDIQRFITEGYRIIIGYNYDSELNKLKTSLPACVIDRVFFVRTSLPFGFYTKEDKIFFTTFNDIFSKYELFTYPRQKIYTGIRLENIWEIQSEDYVVHKEYGIAKFIGIKKISVHGNNKEFLTLLFRDNVCLYIPLTQIDMVEKYISITGKPPSLSPLNREIWNRTTKRVKEKIKEFISQLYTLYTKRKQLKGIKFTRDLELEKMFAETFEYEETEDQKKAIESVLEDMASDYPMDRIIVGDVGFGKTEIALRAAFTAVYNGRQVAVLCPTTVLAEQHYRIFISRFERFGFNVGILTRLQSKKYIEETINKISEGTVDIVIGTHILLTDKIKFANLGLVIIDEEHKFGVRQKEKIRLRFKPKADVSLTNFTDGECFPDVLSLTATPIPRTLAFGLEGIKDISVIETPPEGRLPVETFLLPYDEQVVVDVINRELHRGGQIYYVFNDINLIEHKTNKIKNFFPDVVVEFVHSKLPAKKIEEVMTKFVKEEIQILVSTTIIESGLDIPNVNTIIIEKIENFGLAQLYQLRGRVGRRDKKAYCYLFYSNQDMTINARK